METIEKLDAWRHRFADWRQKRGTPVTELGDDYPFVRNRRGPFTPARRALSMSGLALISSAGAYLDGTDGFDVAASGGDLTFREIPIEIEASDLRFAARGYDTTAIESDINCQIPIQRLLEFEANRIIGQLSPVWFSLNGFIPDAGALLETMLPKLVERVVRYEVQAALLIPASRLCHQTIALLARGIEAAGIPTMMLAVEKDVVEMALAPRAGFYDGQLGSVAGIPCFPEHQRRVLDEALRLIEPMDQPSTRKLTVDLESAVEKSRGER